MFLAFTPFTFFFLCFYFIFFLFLFSTSNFLIFWVFIEFIILIFIGISYTLFANNFSSLILYFLVQTISSFRILFFYLYSNPVFFSLSLFLKLSMFPFHFWFLSICYRFPNFVLFLSSSFHKVPVFLFLLFFSPALSYSFVMLSLLLTVLFSGLIILGSSDFRSVLVSSSVGNNSWFLLSSLLDLFSFLLFFALYCLFLFLLVFDLSNLTKPGLVTFSKGRFYFYYLIIFIRGLPPFPMFFAKIYVIYSIFSSFYFETSYLLIFVLFSCLILVGYIYSLSKYFVHSYSSSSLVII